MPSENSLAPLPHIGEKIRAARLRKNLSLRELAKLAEVSPSLLSKVENGRANPSVRSLHSIAEALSVPVNQFFPDKNDGHGAWLPAEVETAPDQTASGSSLPGVANLTASQLRAAQDTTPAPDPAPGFARERQTGGPVVRAAQRQQLELLGGIIWERLTPTAEEDIEFLQIYYEVGARSGEKMSHHSAREFQYVLEGELLLELGFERYLLKAGDSIIFDSTTPHRLSNAGQRPMRALSVIFKKMEK